MNKLIWDRRKSKKSLIVCICGRDSWKLGCMLSPFSHVWLCVTPWTIAHQAPLSVGFSRQRYWSGLPCPLPGGLPTWGSNLCLPASLVLQADSLPTEPSAAAKSLQSCPILHDPMDCSLPGSSIHGIFQARILEWGAIAFSDWTT